MVLTDSLINLKWIDNIIGINICPSQNFPDDIINNFTSDDITFLFGTFTRPDVCNKFNNALHIVLDHSYSYDETDNIIFIDHHLVEELYNKIYASNSELMFINYKTIFHFISKMLSQFKYDRIFIHMHHDIDGICSGIIMKKILLDIQNSEIDINFDKKIKLAEVVGNFGDISPTAGVGLTAIFNNEESVNIYTKKISLFCRHFSRFMKATRSLYNDFNNFKYIDNNDIDFSNKEFDLYIKDQYINTNDIYKVVHNICNNINAMNNIDTKSILFYFNSIVIDSVINKVVHSFIDICDKFILSCLNPEKNEPAYFESLIRFKNDTYNTVYRLLTIDTPFDCGRTIIWKYKYQFDKILSDGKIGKVKKSKFYYKLIDWQNVNDKITCSSSIDNIVCYNKYLGKLSLDSSNPSAFEIAKYFNGGGHAATDDGRSIGSTVIDDINVLMSNILVVDIF